MTTAIERELKSDHKEISKLLSDLEKANESESKNRGAIFQKLEQKLLAHSKAEDKVYYSKLKKYEKTEDMIYEAKEEHKIITNLLKEIALIDITQPKWKAKCKVLKEMVEHHVEEEEGELFKKASTIIGTSEGENLKTRFLEKKEELVE